MSITGQTGHIALAKQTAFGTPMTTAANYRLVKITGDSIAASNNPLAAEGEIGVGRDITGEIPGGFSAAGAINGDLRVRSAAVLFDGAVGPVIVVPADGAATPPTAASDKFVPADYLPVYTVEKKVGSAARSANELLTLRYTDTMINTLNISAPSGGLATFSAGLIACGETYQATPLIDPVAGTPSAAMPAASNDRLLAFHGGRIKVGDSADGGVETLATDETFQTLEVAINNNVQADEYTIRPSRFLRSLTEGIRNIEANLTLVFEDYHAYQKYTYGATGNTAPGYVLYEGALEFFLGNWQNTADGYSRASGGSVPATNPQAMQINLHKLVYSSLPVTLTTGRIVVSTTARAVKPTTGNIMEAFIRPSGAGF